MKARDRHDPGNPSARSRSPDRNRPRIPEGRSRARALTVFQSPVIESFDIELIGRFPDGGVAGVDLILGRAYGPGIDEVGGVPAGASGSPVYVGEKLIGAVGYLFPPDDRLVGITPIERMRSLVLEPDRAFPRPGSGGSGGAAGVETGRASQSVGFGLNGAPIAWPAGLAPALSSGPAHRIPQVVKVRLGVDVMPAASRPAGLGSLRPLGPGSPMGIPLIDGDIRLGAIGTVTEVKDQIVLGLGHPAFFAGATRLPLTEATIVTTSRGKGSVKIGFLGRTIGAVVQDRAAGILGRTGLEPHQVELTMEITDVDRRVQERLTTRIAPLPNWIGTLVYLAAVEGFARVMNRVGPGEAEWEWSVDVRGSETPVRDEGTEYSPFDIGATVAGAGEGLLVQLVEERAEVERIHLEATVHS